MNAAPVCGEPAGMAENNGTRDRFEPYSVYPIRVPAVPASVFATR
jgi:hypothetical protein